MKRAKACAVHVLWVLYITATVVDAAEILVEPSFAEDDPLGWLGALGSAGAKL